MIIRNHRFEEFWHKQTSNLSSGRIDPSFIVTHYTTGWSGSRSRDWLLGRAGGHPNSEVSAHLVIDRDATVWQIAPFNRRAWHAGRSRYGTVTDLNSHGIGIEFVNPGWLKPTGVDQWVDYYGNRRSTQDLENYGGFIAEPHQRVGSATYAWPLYTEAQLSIGRDIVAALIRHYGIRYVVTHEEIDTREWKTDPGPAFPQRTFVDLLGARGTGQDEIYSVNATRLNIRGEPDRTADRIDPPGSIPFGTRVVVQRREGVWAYVELVAGPADEPSSNTGLLGWVHTGYLELII